MIHAITLGFTHSKMDDHPATEDPWQLFRTYYAWCLLVCGSVSQPSEAEGRQSCSETMGGVQRVGTNSDCLYFRVTLCNVKYLRLTRSSRVQHLVCTISNVSLAYYSTKLSILDVQASRSYLDIVSVFYSSIGK